MALDDKFVSLHALSSLSYYQHLHQDMFDPVTSARLVEPFEYACKRIDDLHDARRFVLGYIADISARPHHYDVLATSDPEEYVADELQSYLASHYTLSTIPSVWSYILDEFENLSS